MFFKRKNKQHRATLPEFSFCEASIKGLQSWVNVLPRTNIRAMANQLIVAGKELTASNCQLSQLLTVLDILNEPITTVASGLLTQPITDDHDIDIYRNRQDFFNLFGHIYCVAGQAQFNNKTKNHLDELLLKANDFLCNATIASYQLYESPPPGCWHLLHKIYQYSLTNCNTEANAVKFSATYKIVVALCCASPERLSAGQIEVLAEYMRTSVVSVRICENPDNQTNFCVAYDEDRQPHRYIQTQTSKTIEKEDAPNQNIIYFDFSQIQKTLTSSCLSPELTKHLNTSYGPPQVRAHTRTATTGSLEICCDLSAIHYFLSGEKAFSSFTNRFNDNYTTETNSNNQVKKTTQNNNDVWNSVYASNWQESEFNGNSIEFKIQNRRVQESQQRPEFSVQRISISDINPNGYKLIGNNIALKAYKPGNLIGIKHIDEMHWHVGIIRWSKAIKHEKNIGVELLTRQIQPYAIKIVHSKHGGDFMPALLLPSSKNELQNAESLDEEASLLLPRLNLNGKTAAIMINEGSKKHIVLGDCVEETGGYCRYFYTDQTKAEERHR